MQQNLTFAGTIAELIAEIRFMGNESWITKRGDAYLEIDLTVGLRKHPMQAPIMPSANKKRGDIVTASRRRVSVPDAVATIKAVANGNRVDLIIDMETDPTRELYGQVHDRWENFKAHLVSRRWSQPATADQQEESSPSLSDMEPPRKAGEWEKKDWCIFFQWVKRVHGDSQPDWKLLASKTAKAYSTIRTMYSRYLSGELDCR